MTAVPALLRARLGRPLVLGHRGAAARAPENTLAAVRAALDAGADGVEIDVRPTRDGVAVVFHDRTLARLCGRPEPIALLRADELRGVRVRGEPIPTLGELLDASGEALVNVEIKDDARLGDGAFAAHVAAVLRRHGAERRAIVSSFNLAALLRLRATAPALATGLLFTAPRRRWRPRVPVERLRGLLRPFALHPDAALVTALRLGRWRREGYFVFTWTVDDPAALRRLARLGVDGVICNDPAAALAVLAPAAAEPAAANAP